ncbi:MAG: acetylxylan esterase [Isosphaeraceae bacterium]
MGTPAMKWLLAGLLLAGMGRGIRADEPGVESLPSHPGLPDPLLFRDGSKVTSAEAWTQRRRPELKGLFAHYMYGKAPAPTAVKATLRREDPGFLGGKATLREVTLTFGPDGTPPIALLLVVPNGAKGPVPVFVGINFYGNHATVTDPKVALPSGWVPAKSPGEEKNHATEKGRGAQADAWAVDTLVSRGYALATFYCGDVAPDHPGLADGVFPSYQGYDWGAVRAWAWGASRVADYLETVSEIDRTRLAVVGHSRLGKAALVAGAYDERFALVIPHQAGCGGTAPSRGKVGESVKQINDRFPHWFNAVFKTFNEKTDRLPMDQHELAALVAPRALLFTNAVEDTWANPVGQFEVLVAAEPVYRLLNAGGLESTTMPPTGKLSAGRLGYAIRPGKHSMTREDWGFFLDFADRHLKK